MKLNYDRDENGKDNIEIEISEENKLPFSYIKLIDSLYKGESIESVTLNGEYSELEKERIEELMNKINETVIQNQRSNTQSEEDAPVDEEDLF